MTYPARAVITIREYMRKGISKIMGIIFAMFTIKANEIHTRRSWIYKDTMTLLIIFLNT